LHQQDRTDFEILKKEIVETMQRTYPGVNPDISDWKGQEITDFQEDLLLKVKAQVSEKWFYTHLKAENHHLPRIDVLNMLSRYAGYTNWDDFRFMKGKGQVQRVLIRKANRVFLWLPLLVVVVLGGFYGLFQMINTRQFCYEFYDAETLQPITNMSIEASILDDHDSPYRYLCDSNGHLRFRTDKSVIEMVINSPYYHADTLRRTLKKFNTREMVALRPDHYALMIHYFSRMDVKDWQKRLNQLDSIIDNDAMIYRVHGGNPALGVELLNKQEFIDFLSLPSQSLKTFRILEIRNPGRKIKLLRYTVNDEQQ
jgi:hypothetical protein